MRGLATEFLKSAGYTVLSAREGAEALELVNRLRLPIDLPLTDVVMPHMRGPELAKQLKSLRPEMSVLFMSAYLEYDPGFEFFLQKPFCRETLVQKVAEALRVGGLNPQPAELVPSPGGH